jgi:hypothetical protein
MLEATSQLEVHSGHIVLAIGWLGIFGALFGYERLRAHIRAPDAHRRQPRTAAAGRNLLWSTAAFSAVAAAIHLSVINEHFQESTLYGAFFLALTAAQFGYAGWILLRPSTAVLKAGAAASAGIVLLWLATRTIGIPVGPAAGEVEPFGLADITATASEALLAICGLLAIRYLPASTIRTPPATSRPTPALASPSTPLGTTGR